MAVSNLVNSVEKVLRIYLFNGIDISEWSYSECGMNLSLRLWAAKGDKYFVHKETKKEMCPIYTSEKGIVFYEVEGTKPKGTKNFDLDTLKSFIDRLLIQDREMIEWTSTKYDSWISPMNLENIPEKLLMDYGISKMSIFSLKSCLFTYLPFWLKKEIELEGAMVLNRTITDFMVLYEHSVLQRIQREREHRKAFAKNGRIDTERLEKEITKYNCFEHSKKGIFFNDSFGIVDRNCRRVLNDCKSLDERYDADKSQICFMFDRDSDKRSFLKWWLQAKDTYITLEHFREPKIPKLLFLPEINKDTHSFIIKKRDRQNFESEVNSLMYSPPMMRSLFLLDRKLAAEPSDFFGFLAEMATEEELEIALPDYKNLAMDEKDRRIKWIEAMSDFGKMELIGKHVKSKITQASKKLEVKAYLDREHQAKIEKEIGETFASEVKEIISEVIYKEEEIIPDVEKLPTVDKELNKEDATSKEMRVDAFMKDSEKELSSPMNPLLF